MRAFLVPLAAALVLAGRSLALVPNVVICPAQFGVPKDYEPLVDQLLRRGHSKVIVAPLSRFDWLKITPSLATADFWKSTLKPLPTLNFYFEALDNAFAEIESGDVSIVGHSIGGWVARAYVGEKSVPVRRVVTLGTPHNPPNTGGIDQTRGLLDYINENYANTVSTCVVGNSSTASSLSELLSKEVWNGQRSPLLESLVALPSYAVLGATLDPFKLRGDGLIPIDAALLPETSAKLIIDDCHHSGFIPTAFDSIILPESYRWYGTPEVVEDWAPALS